MMYLDLDELPGLFESFSLWSADKPAVAWFRRQDHMGDPAKPLKACIQDLIKDETGKEHSGPIRLLTHLRYFGYCMNPVSFYYCWDKADEELQYIVAEVHNTPWGETHCYVLDCQDVDVRKESFQFAFDKKFHVSPFMGMRQVYKWSLSTPGNQLSVNMDNYEGEDRVFNAGMRMQREKITSSSMAKTLANFPFMTLKVVGAIYWQALLLWIRKTPFYSHPETYKSELQQ